jgi:hypothetical protein
MTGSLAGFEVRAATERDGPRMVELDRLAFGAAGMGHYGESHVRCWLEVNPEGLLVASRDGTAVACWYSQYVARCAALFGGARLCAMLEYAASVIGARAGFVAVAIVPAGRAGATCRLSGPASRFAPALQRHSSLSSKTPFSVPLPEQFGPSRPRTGSIVSRDIQHRHNIGHREPSRSGIEPRAQPDGGIPGRRRAILSNPRVRSSSSQWSF